MWRRSRDNSDAAAVRSGGARPPLRWGKVALTAGIVAVVGVTIILGLRLQQRVRNLKHQMAAAVASTQPQPARQVRIQINCPPWMPVELARSVASSLAPKPRMNLDRDQLAQDVYEHALNHPLIRSVEPVRRVPGPQPQIDVVLVQAQFRRPVARVAGPGGYVYVDSQGVRLPVDMIPAWVQPGTDGQRDEYFLNVGGRRPTAQCRAIHYILVNGVQEPMPAVGQAWAGDDLAEGIRLVELVSARGWANQIVSVDVRNYARRLDPESPELVMMAQLGQSKPTLIRFGRFPRADEPFMVPTERKLAYLDSFAQRHEGVIAGFNDWLDLRYDKLHASMQ